MSAGSWQRFAAALQAENTALGELGAASLVLTQKLVFGAAADIEAADRTVDARRILYAQAHVMRAAMMKDAFGDLSLREVCSYAPAPLRRDVFTSLRELRTRRIALQITIGNNKALIVAGLNRIAKTFALMQRSVPDQTRTYRRRGTVTLPNTSLIVSRKA